MVKVGAGNWVGSELSRRGVYEKEVRGGKFLGSTDCVDLI